jgi:hypothetical protein
MTRRPQDLDYAGPDVGNDAEDQQLLVDDYLWTFTANFSSLVVGAVVFGILAKESDGPISAILIGLPILLAQVVLGAIPAWICLRRHARAMSQAQRIVLLTLSVLPIVVGIVGMACAVAGIRLLQ